MQLAEDINLPARSALAVGAKVMLLCNFAANLMNGSVGDVKKIVYRSREGPCGRNGPHEHPAYVIVDFPDCTIPEDEKLIDDMPRTCVPVATVTLRCENNCCSATTIPLRVCKAITGHKSQGQSIGEGHPWSKAVVCIPCRRNKTPGLEQVSISRATSLSVLALDDTQEELTYEQLMSIGKGQAYEKRRQFEQTMQQLAEETQQHFRQRIIGMDPNQESPTFDGGFDAVVRLYRDQLSTHSQNTN
jgi:ATP-dependent exoDNAse (exonuclease V) alpha subunit